MPVLTIKPAWLISRASLAWADVVIAMTMPPSRAIFTTLKSESVQGKVYASRAEAKAELFEYIELFYNRHRLHSQLGYFSTSEYEPLSLVA